MPGPTCSGPVPTTTSLYLLLGLRTDPAHHDRYWNKELEAAARRGPDEWKRCLVALAGGPGQEQAAWVGSGVHSTALSRPTLEQMRRGLSLSCLRLKQQHLLSPGGFPGPSPGPEPACRLPATAASSIKGPRGLAQQVLLMTPIGHLYLLRVRGAHLLLLLLLGLLLALLPEAQGLPDVGLSAAQTAHYHSQKHFARGVLKPAAHLVGDPGTQSALRWRANTDRAFLRHGFSLSNNSLLVPTSGLYFVYSQVVFSGQGCFPKATPTPLYLAHEVQLFSPQYPFHVSLLSAQKSVCPGPQGPWVRSVYQGAVFLLTQGDQLSTHTDGISHLLLSPSSVFFGAFAL